MNFRNRAEYAKDGKSKYDNIYRKCKLTSGDDCVVVEVGLVTWNLENRYPAEAFPRPPH